MLRPLFALLLSLASLNALAELSPEQLEEWFNNDKLDMPEEAAVQDEQLRFITQTNKKNIPVTEKTYRISTASLKTGWVVIEQCYYNLDPVPQLEVVYEYQHMRKLSVTSQQGVGKLWIEGQTIQMENLRKGASVCTQAEVRILRRTDSNKYLLLAGPFKRKFLDGYYPMHVKLKIHFPAEQLKITEMFPESTTGFSTQHAPGLLQIDTRFTGKLYLALGFTTTNAAR